MKTLYRALGCFALVVGMMVGSVQSSKACDRAEFRLDSINTVGACFDVHATICVGAGVLGTVQGGDNNTTNLFFMAWADPGCLIKSFTPTFTSDTTMCTLSGSIFGPIGGGPLAGVETRVHYTPTTACEYTCVSSTAGCGRPHTDCASIVITFNTLPDSLRCLSAEGTGSPLAGCFRPLDMVIDFTILPVVWASFDAQQKDETVEVNWSTVSETNNDHFKVMRSDDGFTWDQLAEMPAAGNSDTQSDYGFTDNNPQQGINYYKIIQTDIDGRFSETEVASVNFDLDSKMEWRQIGPMPTTDFMNVSFMSPQDESLTFQLVGMDGSILEQKNIDALYGMNKFELDLTNQPSGVYFIRLSGSEGTLNRKVIKI